jgi:hypothetical protein
MVQEVDGAFLLDLLWGLLSWAAAQMQVLVSSLCMCDDARWSGHRTDAIGMIEV